MKKVLAILLVFTLLLAQTSAFAEGISKAGYPVTEEPVTLRVLTGTGALTPQDINTMTIFKKAEEAMNIHIEWITAPSGSAYNDKLSLMLATDDLPDIILGGVSEIQLVKYGSEGSFIPMEDLVEEYAPNLCKLFELRSDLRGFSTAPDGHMYGLPRVSEGPWMLVKRIYNINTQWLEQLGLSMPTNLSEFKNALLAVKNGDPNGNGIADEIPITFASGSSFTVSVFEYIFGAYGLSVAPSLLDLEGNKVVCVATDDRYKKGIEYLHSLYAEDLIDPDSFVMDSAQWKAKVNALPVQVFVSPNWDYNDNVSNPEILAQYGMMAPLYGDQGEEPNVYATAQYGYTRGFGVITKACQNPEAAMRWLDYWYEEINTYESAEGPIGERLFYDENGTLLLNGGDVVAASIPRDSVCLNSYMHRAMLKEYIEENRIAYPSTFPKVNFVLANVMSHVDQDPFPKVFYTVDESETLSMMQVNLINYINSQAADWIINGGVEEQWDGYLAQLENMGLSEYLAIQQAAYERYIEN